MILFWMLHGLAVGALFAGSAWLLEHAMRLNARPARWVWILALLATGALVASAPHRNSSGDVTLGATSAGIPTPSVMSNGSAQASMWSDLLTSVRRIAAVPLGSAGDLLRSRAPRGFGTPLVFGWAIASTLLLLAFAATLLRTALLQRRWRSRTIEGVPVRVAPSAGPMVVGIVRPSIVVPEWLLLAPAHEQRMALAHELEHIRTRDPLLLVAGCLLVALLPWNPAVWWMAARLRLAVEMDCDARVLRRVGDRAAYGAVLLEVAGRRTGEPLGALALLESPAQLERRLIAMTSRTARFGTLRGLALAALAAPLVLAACETPLPSTPEIEGMDVAAAESGAARVGLMALSDNPNTVYLIDGREVNAADAHALDATRIAAIEVERLVSPGETQTHPLVQIWTPEGLDARGRSDAPEEKRLQVVVPDGPDRHIRIGGTDGVVNAKRFSAKKFEGLLLIDGQEMDPLRLQDVDPKTIESVEVLKGHAATRLYSNPAAAKGVIRITTKAGTATREQNAGR